MNQKIKDMMNEAGEGEFVIQYLGGTEIIGWREQVDACLKGIVDIVSIWTTAYPSVVPGASAAALSQYNQIEERDIGFHDLMVDLHEEAGLRYIGRVGLAEVWLWTNIRAEEPTDLAGAVWGGQLEMFNIPIEVLGGTVTPVSTSDIYSAFERGMIDGFTEGARGMVGASLHEVVDYVVGPPVFNTDHVVIMNLNTWNSLSQNAQTIIEETMKEADVWLLDQSLQQLTGNFQDMLDEGVEHIEWSTSDTEWYINIVYDEAWRITAEGIDDATLTAQIRAMITK
jgi:hypothetical protein